jgi:hypothetical protein
MSRYLLNSSLVAEEFETILSVRFLVFSGCMKPSDAAPTIPGGSKAMRRPWLDIRAFLSYYNRTCRIDSPVMTGH